MTREYTGHTEFHELAAGYVLHALDPADEQRFLEHAAGCPDCEAQIAQFAEVAAALAEVAAGGTGRAAEPGDGLGARILAATRPGPAGAAPDDSAALPSAPKHSTPKHGAAKHGAPKHGDVVPLRPRQRWLHRAAVAAAAVLVAGGGIWGGLAATSGGTQAPLAMCERPHSCTEVPLVGTASHRVTAKVIVTGHEAWMLPAGITANPGNDIYVLWQITGSPTPLAVGKFDVRAGGHTPIRIGALAAPYSGTRAFAVSLEHGRAIPATPSNKQAVGQVS